MRTGSSIAVIVLLVLLALLLLGGFGMMGFGMMGGGMMRGFGFSPVGWGLTLLFWVLVIAGIVLIAIALTRNASPGSASISRAPETPLDVLKMRYARGEITKEQYDAMRRDLGANG